MDRNMSMHGTHVEIGHVTDGSPLGMTVHHHNDHHHHHGHDAAGSNMATGHSDMVDGHGQEEMGSMHEMHMHAMHFTPQTLTDFLFKGVRISSIEGIITTMLLVTIVTMLLECFNVWLHFREKQLLESRDSDISRDSKCHANSNRYYRLLTLCVSTVLKMFTVALGYIIMLCVMSMNLWLFLSAILGSGLGHLFLRPLLTAKLQVEKGEKTDAQEMTVLNANDKEERYDLKDEQESAKMLQ